MPTYQYRCDDCSESFERVQKFSEDALTVCPTCDGVIRRVIGNVGVVFKGTGWYINDSRKTESKAVDKSAESSPKKDEGAAKVDSGKETAKPAATTSTDSAKTSAPAATTT